MSKHHYTINGSSESISLAGDPEVTDDTLLYHSGFLRHNQFNLYIEGEETPLESVNLSHNSSFTALPRNEDPGSTPRR